METSPFEPLWPRWRLVVCGALASGLCLLALVARCGFVGRRALVFMAWNLFLASVPLLITCAQAAMPKRLSPVFDFAWLMFLPNAPYLVTDLIHLTARPPVPLWFDVLFFVGFAATGCWLGLVSLEVVIARIARRFGTAWSHTAAAAICVLTAYGVFMGRFFRLNSWDVVDRPLRLFELASAPLLDPAAHPGAVAFTAGFAVFLGMQWLGLKALADPRP